MDPNALSSASASLPEAHPQTPTASGTDGAGAAGNVPPTGKAESILRASAGAVRQHLDETGPKRGKAWGTQNFEPGSGADSPLGDSADPALLAEGAPAPLQSVVEAPPAFDEEMAKKVVGIAIDLLNDGAAAVVRAVAKKETGDMTHANEAADSVRMSEKYRETIEFGAIACARKYAVNMAYAPEMMLGGGLVLWLGNVAMVIKAEKAKGAELRERREAA